MAAGDRSRIDEVVQRGPIARDLLAEMPEGSRPSRHDRLKAHAPQRHDVIIELNNDYPGGARTARARLLGDYLSQRDERSEDYEPGPERELLGAAWQEGELQPIAELTFHELDRIYIRKSAFTDSYLFAKLTTDTVRNLASIHADETSSSQTLVYKIWLDGDCRAFVYDSYRTIKCDAAQTAFAAKGHKVLWAVADTGIQADHPHFQTHATLDLPNGIRHRDFTDENLRAADAHRSAQTDQDGHGTHVAGIIAGQVIVGGEGPTTSITVTKKRRGEDGRSKPYEEHRDAIAGAAPLTKLLSLKVLTDRDTGKVSMLIAAIGYIQRINEYGRNLRVHGLNLSLGYPFDPEWFAAGQSPLCKEVDRLVKSGVVVVAAAGNGGYGTVNTQSGSQENAAHASTVADPGNAELAITVGATHRDRPHEYGVSYFSAKGPTADGRNKPDLVAPGERIVSCALAPPGAKAGVAYYREDTGTSMAAPHVSAAIAAFLSARAEFIGKPEQVKALFLSNATNLGRQPAFQGAGLIDLMRTLQAV